MKHILFLLIFITSLPSRSAENNSLVVYLNSGAKIIFPIEDSPKITFESSILCIETERYQISDVKKYTFSKNEAASIQEVEDNKSGLNFSFLDGEKIAVSVKDPSAVVHIYSSNGTEYGVKRENGMDGNIIIDMAGLMPDVYLIAIGNETIKIRKR